MLSGCASVSQIQLADLELSHLNLVEIQVFLFFDEGGGVYLLSGEIVFNSNE